MTHPSNLIVIRPKHFKSYADDKPSPFIWIQFLAFTLGALFSLTALA